MHLQNPTRIERRLGDTEVSYFLPSRESGVNDMYLLIGFSAEAQLVKRDRVARIWAILRLKHPLLSSSVEMHEYNDIRFVFKPYSSPEGALQDAQDNLRYQNSSKDELQDSYLNGPRTLSAERLSFLILSHEVNTHALKDCPSNAQETRSAEAEASINYHLMICATHFVGDGMAVHQLANDFLILLSSDKNTEELHKLLNDEWRSRYGGQYSEVSLPSSLEERLPSSPGGAFYRTASRVDFLASQDRLLGGHSFPKCVGNERRTLVPTVSFDEQRTRTILKACKTHGVSISSALFAICNIAWFRTTNQKSDLPIMMYSALNLRPYLSVDKLLHDSYCFIAIGYFNVVLPAFFPKSGEVSRTFWHRARKIKAQSTDAAKNRMAISRNREMARERAERARVWAKEDDNRALGMWSAPPPSTGVPNLVPTTPSKPPSTALIGLSLLGNLDGIYKHAAFPQVILYTLTNGSRQRSGGMLLFGYTFAGKLWVSLGYDVNGFDKDVVERFWGHVLSSIDELLVC